MASLPRQSALRSLAALSSGMPLAAQWAACPPHRSRSLRPLLPISLDEPPDDHHPHTMLIQIPVPIAAQSWGSPGGWAFIFSSSTSPMQTWVPSLRGGPTGQPSGRRHRACSPSLCFPPWWWELDVPWSQLPGPSETPADAHLLCPAMPTRSTSASPSFARDSSSFWIWFSKKSIATAKATTASSCNLGGIIILRSPMKPAARDQDIPRGAGSGAPRATEAPGGDPDPGAARTAAPQRPPSSAQVFHPREPAPAARCTLLLSPPDGPGALLSLPPGSGTPRPHALFPRFLPFPPRSLAAARSSRSAAAAAAPPSARPLPSPSATTRTLWRTLPGNQRLHPNPPLQGRSLVRRAAAERPFGSIYGWVPWQRTQARRYLIGQIRTGRRGSSWRHWGFIDSRQNVVNEEHRCGEFKEMPDLYLWGNLTAFK